MKPENLRFASYNIASFGSTIAGYGAEVSALFNSNPRSWVEDFCDGEYDKHDVGFWISQTRYKEICAYLTQLPPEKQPHVVGLSEVWDHGFKKAIYNRVKEVFPYACYQHAPRSTTNKDADKYLQYVVNDLPRTMGNGLMLLSKFPLDRCRSITFRDLGSWDAKSQKGVLGACVYPYGDKRYLRVFMTHTQAGYKGEYQSERLSNMAEIDAFVEHGYFPGGPAIVMGDFNIVTKRDDQGHTTHALDVSTSDGVFGPSFSDTYDECGSSEENEDLDHIDYIMASKNGFVSQSAERIVNPQLSDHPLFISEVEVTSPGQLDDRPGELGRPLVQLMPNGQDAGINYEVSFKTGSKKRWQDGFTQSAGTDSDVKIRFVGNNQKDTDWVLCDTAIHNDFEANKTDTFRFFLQDVGQLKAIDIDKDNSGPGPDWYLKRVTVTVDGQVYRWKKGRWIKKKIKRLTLTAAS